MCPNASSNLKNYNRCVGVGEHFCFTSNEIFPHFSNSYNNAIIMTAPLVSLNTFVTRPLKYSQISRSVSVSKHFCQTSDIVSGIRASRYHITAHAAHAEMIACKHTVTVRVVCWDNLAFFRLLLLTLAYFSSL